MGNKPRRGTKRNRENPRLHKCPRCGFEVMDDSGYCPDCADGRPPAGMCKDCGLRSPCGYHGLCTVCLIEGAKPPSHKLRDVLEGPERYRNEREETLACVVRHILAAVPKDYRSDNWVERAIAVGLEEAR